MVKYMALCVSWLVIASCVHSKAEDRCIDVGLQVNTLELIELNGKVQRVDVTCSQLLKQ